jgi:quercetin dioxygenase-like cupin family protein
MARASWWVATRRRQGHVEQTAPGSERPLHGPLQRFDLGTVVGRLKEEGAWQRGQRNSITLRKGGGMNVVLLVMKAGDRLEEHAAPGPLSLSVREGRIRFVAGEEVVEAESDTLLTCDAGVRHSVAALERRGVPAHHRGVAPLATPPEASQSAG